MSDREPPIVLAPLEKVEGPKRAAVIFMHGLGDDAAGLQNVGHQLQQQHVIPYAKWIFPNGTDNEEAMMRAWYTPTPLSPFPSQRPELDDPEDEEGLLSSMNYIVSLIDEQVADGVPLDRIVVGGFSQGCAMSLLTGLISKHSGQLAGVLGIAGYFPLAGQIAEMRHGRDLPAEPGKIHVFLTRGTRDVLVPRRYFSEAQNTLKSLGVKEDLIEPHEYENVGHTITGAMLKDMAAWLNKVLPQV